MENWSRKRNGKCGDWRERERGSFGNTSNGGLGLFSSLLKATLSVISNSSFALHNHETHPTLFRLCFELVSLFIENFKLVAIYLFFK